MALARALGLSPAQADDLRRAAAGRGLWLRILGPLETWRDGSAVVLGGAAQRAVLGLLALSPGSLVHRSAIIDVLWPGGPPANAVNLVQAHVSRLRRVLLPGHRSDNWGLLSSAGASYRLGAGSAQLDLLEFGQLTAEAHAAHSSGDYDTACGFYQQALALWQGEPLADVDLLRGHPAVLWLGRRRAEAVIEYARVASGAGWHSRVVPVLQELAVREPLNERAHAQLMIALAGCGQQAQALTIYHDLCQRLDDELAMPPGQDLARAHELVLRQDIPAARETAVLGAPGLGAPSLGAADLGAPGLGTAGHATAAQAVPQQLPVAPVSFTGRAAELAKLGQLLDEPTETMKITVIGGTAGVGKTALAVYWSHQAAKHFPDGQLYVDLSGFRACGPPARPGDVLRRFLESLGVPADRIPPDMPGQAGLYRGLLTGKRVLIVLDNACDEQQVRPLLPASPGCLVIVTSRNKLVGLAAAEGARLLNLDVLLPGEARQMLIRRFRTARPAAGFHVADFLAVDEITRLCDYLPLAVAAAAGRVAARPRLPLTAVATELRDAQCLLDALDTGDPETSVRAVFSLSIGRLSTDAATMFRLLGLHPGPDISVPAAASLAGVPLAQARRALGELARAHLLCERSPGRYSFHDLLRACAAERAHASDMEEGREAAIGRMLDHYLHTARHASALLFPDAEPAGLGSPRPGVTPEHVAGHRSAWTWLQSELHVMFRTIALAARAGFDTYARELPAVLGSIAVYEAQICAYLGDARRGAGNTDASPACPPARG